MIKITVKKLSFNLQILRMQFRRSSCLVGIKKREKGNSFCCVDLNFSKVKVEKK
jgi:hypothetical protein